MFDAGRLRYVAAGGVVGALVRWAALSVVTETSQGMVIFGLNLFGSFLLGYLVASAVPSGRRRTLTDNQFALLGVGFFGSLTTFSTYALSVATAIESGHAGDGAGLALSTAFGAVLGAGLGYRSATLIHRRKHG